MKTIKFTKQQKIIFKNLISDIKLLKKHNYYSIPENKQFYLNLCDIIIKSIKKTINPTKKTKYENNKKNSK